jgi:hypothetical protein
VLIKGVTSGQVSARISLVVYVKKLVVSVAPSEVATVAPSEVLEGVVLGFSELVAGRRD